MSFVIITDTSANIPSAMARKLNIQIIPFSYYIDGSEHTCYDTSKFNAENYYKQLGDGMQVTTSQITPQRYVDCFTKYLELKKDILFISMSSGISGSCHSAMSAADQLKGSYPGSRIEIIDSLAASLGEGMLAIEAAKLKAAGKTIDEVIEAIISMRSRLYQVFTVDDLMFLKRGGRLSGITAGIATVLNIKPLLKGNEDGKIVAFSRVRGRKKSIEAIASRYNDLVEQQAVQTAYIAHCGCKSEAVYLATLIKNSKKPKSIMIVDYEPVTGSYVGPGAIALFFLSCEGACMK